MTAALGVAIALFTPIPAMAAPQAAKAGKTVKPARVVPATVEAIWKEIKRPGAKLVVVNVWATWCEPCREEMPDILRTHRENQARGMRLMLISADAQTAQPAVGRYLASLGVDVPSFLKVGDDMEFIDGLSPKWDGTLPSTLLFDGAGKPLHTFTGIVSYAELKKKIDQILSPQPRSPP